MKNRIWAPILVAATLATDVASAEPATPRPIAPLACLRKLALDLTNQGPSYRDVADLKSGAKTLGGLADEYLASSAHAQVAFDWHRGAFAPTPKMPRGVDVEEPARLAAYLHAQDKDFRQLVTAHFAVAANGSTTDLG